MNKRMMEYLKKDPTVNPSIEELEKFKSELIEEIEKITKENDELMDYSIRLSGKLNNQSAKEKIIATLKTTLFMIPNTIAVILPFVIALLLVYLVCLGIFIVIGNLINFGLSYF